MVLLYVTWVGNIRRIFSPGKLCWTQSVLNEGERTEFIQPISLAGE